MTQLDQAADIGAGDGSFANRIGQNAKAAAHAVANKIHPMIEQYAQLFTHGARTPVLRRPDEVGSIMRKSSFRVSTAYRSTGGSFRRQAIA